MSTTAAYTGKDPDGGPGDRRAMKVCQVCGDIYRDHVDFCFNDGEILVADAAVTSPLSAAHLELDPPMPRRVQGGQAAPAVPGGWPQAVPVSRPGAAHVEPPVAQTTHPGARSTPTPAVIRSTEITVPPESTPSAESVPSTNRDGGRPTPGGVPDGDPDGVDDAIDTTPLPDDTTATDDVPTIPPLLPSAVPTPVTPEPRDVLRVAPNNDRPSTTNPGVAALAQTPTPGPNGGRHVPGSQSGPSTEVDPVGLRPVPGKSQTPAPASPARPASPVSSQTRGGAAAVAVDPSGERSNWLMIGAVFAVGVLFSVMGAGAVLAGMLYQGAPWGEVQEPVTRHDPPTPITAPQPLPDPLPDPTPEPVPVDVVPVPVPMPETPTPNVVAPVPVPAAPSSAVPGGAPVVPAPKPAPPADNRFPVLLKAVEGAIVRNVNTGNVLADPAPRTSRLEAGTYQLRYERAGFAPIDRQCVVPDPKVAPGQDTDCSVDVPFTPIAKPGPSSAAQVIKTNVVGPKGTITIDAVFLGETNQSYLLEVGTHECVVATAYSVKPFTVSCDVTPTVVNGTVGVLNLTPLIPQPPAPTP